MSPYANQLPIFVSLLTSAIICGAWWFAAIRKRKVAIFYWLAAAHTLSFGIHALQISYSLSKASAMRYAAISPMYMLVGVVLAGLYVALVRWLVNQPGDTP